jgi:ribosomal protein L1
MPNPKMGTVTKDVAAAVKVRRKREKGKGKHGKMDDRYMKAAAGDWYS